MNEAIKILKQKEVTYQQMLDADIGSGEEAVRLKDELKIRLSEVTEAINLLEQSRKPVVSPPLPLIIRCEDCGKVDETVQNRGAFYGTICYECKKTQDIEDEECR